MKAISFLLTSNLPSKADTVHGLGEFYQAFQEDPALKESRAHNWGNLLWKGMNFLSTCVYEVSVKVHIF